MELLRALGVLAEPPADEHEMLAEVLGLPRVPDPAVYADLFVMQLHPYASVYLGPEGMLGGEARQRIAGFWRALHQEAPDEPDHLSGLLGLAATLADAEAREGDPASARLLRSARAALLWEHLLPWLPPFLHRVGEVGGPFHQRWAELLQKTLRSELRELGALNVTPRHLSEVAGLSDPRECGAAAFLAALLAPVRSGLILLRCDLSRAADDLGLGLRSGERLFVLEALLSQGPQEVLSWLAGEARTRAVEHSTRLKGLGPIGEHWIERATKTSHLLDSLAAESGLEVPA